MSRSLSLFIVILYGFIPGLSITAQEITPTVIFLPIAIYSPTPGQALQGTVLIQGNITPDGFQTAELSFSYKSDPRGTWFLIRQFTTPPLDEILAEWDTTTLTDGDYILRLMAIYSEENQPSETLVEVRVRNYTLIETDTPAPTNTLVPGKTPSPSAIPTLTDTPIPLTPTQIIVSIPTNPAELTSKEISNSMIKGILTVLAAFILLGLVQAIRFAVKKGGRR